MPPPPVGPDAAPARRPGCRPRPSARMPPPPVGPDAAPARRPGCRPRPSARMPPPPVGPDAAPARRPGCPPSSTPPLSSACVSLEEPGEVTQIKFSPTTDGMNSPPMGVLVDGAGLVKREIQQTKN
ncbi:proline-rich protein HaeIII subfamily 1-like [Schistocerca nitens]|uniref:proline-rich protein HaeIII subfamily 1-like n=1 Tax=Schistocerca nitens TaxID=7011 RepID=UPI002119537F|nr:proline-rich protein HaeIII subfamily 1-like [Schistocerca nitens]